MYQGKFSNSNQEPAPRRRRPRKKGPTQGTKLFYTVYAGFFAIIFIVILCALIPLNSYLVNLEASDPNSKRDAVFNQLFADPDWEEIYELANLADEGPVTKESYADTMNNLVGDQELTAFDYPLGTGDDKMFIVLLEDKLVASFILTPITKDNGDVHWELASLDVPRKTVNVVRYPGQTVYVNGFALTDDYVVKTVRTGAEDYLPADISGYQADVLRTTVFCAEPTVTVKDALGMELAVTKDETTGVYSTQAAEPSVATDEQKNLALEAMKIYGKFMTSRASLSEVQKYFSTNSQFYKALSKSEWLRPGASIAFTEPVYSDFYKYSDNLFSIMIDITLKQTDKNGWVKDYNLCNTLFFQYTSGKWKVMEATNVNVQEKNTEVRVTFMDGENTISDEFVSADTLHLNLPAVTVPEGYKFLGWYSERGDTLIIPPTESNTVDLSGEELLEPMTLYARYQEAE